MNKSLIKKKLNNMKNRKSKKIFVIFREDSIFMCSSKDGFYNKEFAHIDAESNLEFHKDNKTLGSSLRANAEKDLHIRAFSVNECLEMILDLCEVE